VDIRLDRGSEIPVGVQLAWHLRARMVAGELEAGAKLPSVRDMAAATHVNANTVRAVYARLEAEGLLDTHHGRGTFVVEGAQGSDDLAAITGRAARDAAAAGVDPRAVAAALYVGGGAAGDEEAARRHGLRAEIAALERRLAEPRLQRVLAAHAEDPLVAPAPAPRGRLLTTAELEAQRDELRDRLSLLLTAPDSPLGRGGPPTATAHSTAPGVRVTLAPSPPRWRLGHAS
jgi:DNA-binding transcriptional regulator YhcF (GntR family)